MEGADPVCGMEWFMPLELLACMGLCVQEVQEPDLRSMPREQLESNMSWAGFAVLSVSSQALGHAATMECKPRRSRISYCESHESPTDTLHAFGLLFTHPSCE